MISSSATRFAAGRTIRVNRSGSNVIGRLTRARSSRFVACRGAPVSALLRGQIPSLNYSTERIVQLKSGKKSDELSTLYDASRETENCGVGLVASLKSIPSRRVVDDADEMLVRMSHRGGCGCDPASGDGAGKLI